MKHLTAVARMLLAFGLGFAGFDAVFAAEPVYELSFERGLEGVKTDNYKNRLTVGCETVLGEPAFVAKNLSTKGDVMWGLGTPRFRVRAGAEFAIRIRALGDVMMDNPRPLPVIRWLDGDGNPILAQDALGADSPVTFQFGFRAVPNAWTDTAHAGIVPRGARQASVSISADRPDLCIGQRVAISRISYFERKDGESWDFGDLEGPVSERISPSPTGDLNASVRIRVTDPSGVDWSRFACYLDGSNVTSRILREGDIITYRPAESWKTGTVHEFRLVLADRRGNERLDSQFLCLADGKPAHESVAVRDDGVVLLDGKPFFPISIASVRGCTLNGNSVSNGVRQLAEAGFNVLHTYLLRGRVTERKAYDAFVAACDREGVKVWPEPGVRNDGANRDRMIRETILEGRGHPSTFAWTTGDDTADHNTPAKLVRDWRLIRAVDPGSVATQADSCTYEGRVSRFAKGTDIFRCEVYPLRAAEPEPHEFVQLQQNLRFARSDMIRGGAVAPCVVPIVQTFRGWSHWKRFPTYEEIRGLTFLSIVNRARGIEYYTYVSGNGEGAASTQERFESLCRVSREVAALKDDLVSRDAKVQPAVAVVSGPEEVEHTPSVTALEKESGLLMAVNLSLQNVRVRLSWPTGRQLEADIPPRGVWLSRLGERSGLAVETKAIQRRIDKAAANGGGTVTIPAGRHLTGQLEMKSNVELHLVAGAVLEGVAGLENYRATCLPYSEGDWRAIIFALGVTNVAVTGAGRIEGRGNLWPLPRYGGGDQEGLRPRGLFFGDSKGIRLEGFTLRDSACWGCVFKRCEDVTVRRVKVDSHANANNDGFDIEAKDVLIEDCDVDSGDDAYCLKSNDPGFTVENVRIRNCVARSHCNGFKIGTATHGTIRNVCFEHCRTEAPQRDFVDLRTGSPNVGRPYFHREGFPSCPERVGLGAITIENVDGGRVEGIHVTDIEVSGFMCPIFIRAGKRTGRVCGTPPGNQYVFQDVLVENVRGCAESGFPSSVTGVEGCPVRNVTLKNVRIVCPGAPDEMSRFALEHPVPDVSGCYPECKMFMPHILPAYGLYVDNAENVRLDDVKFELIKGAHDLRPDIVRTNIARTNIAGTHPAK